MNKIVLLSLLAFPFSARCQYADTTKTQRDIESRIHRAGLELMAYKRQVSIGTTLEVVGAIGAIAGSATDAQTNKGFIAGSIGLSIIGFIVQQAAISHIGRAGIYLRGNGIVISLGK